MDQECGVASPGFHDHPAAPPPGLVAHDDPDISVQSGEEPHQTFDGEIIESAAVDQRDLRLIDAEQLRRLRLAELTLFKDLNDRAASFAFARSSSGLLSPRSLKMFPLPRMTPLSFLSAGPRVTDMNRLVELVFGPLLTVHQWLYEHSDGRIGASLGGRPMLLLRTVGRRTNQSRTAALLYVRDGDAYVVIASKGGAPKHPGWFYNLTAQPDVEVQVGRERIPVRARVAAGAERSRLWARADEINRGQYATYQSRTSRVIPIVVLERIPSRRSGRTTGA